MLNKFDTKVFLGAAQVLDNYSDVYQLQRSYQIMDNGGLQVVFGQANITID